MAELKAGGSAARTVNFRRQIANAFMNWCVRHRRIKSNPLSAVPRLDETRDRRRVRRPLTDEELERLLAVAEERGRKAWYLCAALAGLRRGDLVRLRWADVDLKAATITLTHGKAKRVDVLPLHPDLAHELEKIRPEAVEPTAPVFPTAVTTRTQQRDFLRAGLAREEVVKDENGEPVMVGKGTKRSPLRPKTRIVTDDAEGRVIDLHALRTTLATQLARQGVAPQIAQQIMRHGDYRTTLEHYTKLDV
ncbi:MAG: tyrosine-type recombinase/integrase [bacterium]|nr:tyrosine-type recombinase/integrase [bacterium]